MKSAASLLLVIAVTLFISAFVAVMGAMTWALFLPQPIATDISYLGMGWAFILGGGVAATGVPAILLQEELDHRAANKYLRSQQFINP